MKKEMDLKLIDITKCDKNKLVEQFQPLIYKITHQFASRVKMDFDSIKSMAYEGFAIAINNYDPKKSNMNFLQYAAFSIRNYILIGLDNESRTVKLSFYAQQKAIQNGESLFNTVSCDVHETDNDDEKGVNLLNLNMYETAKFADGDVFEYIYTFIDNKFSKRDSEVFYMTYGLRGFDETKGVDVAKFFHVTTGMISQINKKIVTAIRKDENAIELLASLVTK